jgi:hypothetical protein
MFGLCMAVRTVDSLWDEATYLDGGSGRCIGHWHLYRRRGSQDQSGGEEKDRKSVEDVHFEGNDWHGNIRLVTCI